MSLPPVKTEDWAAFQRDKRQQAWKRGEQTGERLDGFMDAEEEHARALAPPPAPAPTPEPTPTPQPTWDPQRVIEEARAIDASRAAPTPSQAPSPTATPAPQQGTVDFGRMIEEAKAIDAARASAAEGSVASPSPIQPPGSEGDRPPSEQEQPSRYAPRSSTDAVERNRPAIEAAFGDLGPQVVDNMVRFSGRESGGNPTAFKTDDIEDSHGILQINARAHPELARKYDLNDPYQNAQAAREVYDQQGYGAWHNAAKAEGLLDGGTPTATAQERPAGSRPRLNANDIANQFDPNDELDPNDAAAACGPALAAWFAASQGRQPTLKEATDLARQYGWNRAGGMNGLQNESRLLDGMGVAHHVTANVNEDDLIADVNSGNPVGISTGFHYFGADAYDPQTGRFHVGRSGLNVRGGSEWMSLSEIDAASKQRGAGGINGAIFVDNPSTPNPSLTVDAMASGEGDRPASETEAPSRYTARAGATGPGALGASGAGFPPESGYSVGAATGDGGLPNPSLPQPVVADPFSPGGARPMGQPSSEPQPHPLAHIGSVIGNAISQALADAFDPQARARRRQGMAQDELALNTPESTYNPDTQRRTEVEKPIYEPVTGLPMNAAALEESKLGTIVGGGMSLPARAQRAALESPESRLAMSDQDPEERFARSLGGSDPDVMAGFSAVGPALLRAYRAIRQQKPNGSRLEAMGEALDSLQTGHEAINKAMAQNDPTGGLAAGAAATGHALATDPIALAGGLGGLGGRGGVALMGAGGAAGGVYAKTQGMDPEQTAEAVRAGADAGGLLSMVPGATHLADRAVGVGADAARSAGRALAEGGPASRELGIVPPKISPRARAESLTGDPALEADLHPAAREALVQERARNQQRAKIEETELGRFGKTLETDRPSYDRRPEDFQRLAEVEAEVRRSGGPEPELPPLTEPLRDGPNRYDPAEVLQEYQPGSVEWEVEARLRRSALVSPDGLPHLSAGEITERVPFAPREGRGVPAYLQGRARSLDDLRTAIRVGYKHKDWYEAFAKHIRGIVGESNMNEAASIFGITSAQTPVDDNVAQTFWVMTQARKLLAEGVNNRDEFVRRLDQAMAETKANTPLAADRNWSRTFTTSKSQQIANVYFEGKHQMGAAKTSSYMGNILSALEGHFDPNSTNDVWILRDVFGYAKPDDAGSTDNTYRSVNAIVNYLAREEGLMPHQVQAAMWVAGRQLRAPDGVTAAQKAKAQSLIKLVDRGELSLKDALEQAEPIGLWDKHENIGEVERSKYVAKHQAELLQVLDPNAPSPYSATDAHLHYTGIPKEGPAPLVPRPVNPAQRAEARSRYEESVRRRMGERMTAPPESYPESPLAPRRNELGEAAGGAGIARGAPTDSTRGVLEQGASALGGAAASQIGTDEDTTLEDRGRRALLGAEAGLGLRNNLRGRGGVSSRLSAVEDAGGTTDIFYSQLRRAAEAIRQPRGGAAQMQAMLRSAGVKAEEMKWTGMDDLLERAKKEGRPVTRDEILSHLDQNEVKVDEIIKGGEPPTNEEYGRATQAAQEEFSNFGKWIRESHRSNYIGDEPAIDVARKVIAGDPSRPLVKEAAHRIAEVMGVSLDEVLERSRPAREAVTEVQRARVAYERGADQASTRFDQYVLPGGEPDTYRELVMTLPTSGKFPTYEDWVTKRYGGTIDPAEAPASVRREYQRQLEAGAVPGRESADYRSSHWPSIDNPVVHVRFDERVVDGKKTLFVDEIQSDWHQQGRSEGYTSPPEDPKVLEQRHYDANVAAEAAAQKVSEIRAMQREARDQAETDLLAHLLEGKSSNERMFIKSQHANAVEEALQSDPVYQDLIKQRRAAEEGLRAALDAETEAQAARDRGATGSPSAVAPAPFEKTWPELAVKRMVRYAAENGFDRIAFAPGKVHAGLEEKPLGRWGTERMAWTKDRDGFFNVTVEPQVSGHAPGIDNLGEHAMAQGLVSKQDSVLIRDKADLERAIFTFGGLEHPGARERAEGRTVVDRMWKRMQAADTGVMMPRKEGMEGFYDKSLPTVVGDLVKKFGAKVEKSRVQYDASTAKAPELDALIRDAANTGDHGAAAILGEVQGRQATNNALDEHEDPIRLLGEVRDTALEQWGKLDNPELGVTESTWAKVERILKNTVSTTGLEVHHVDITPQMRESVVQQGFPLFLPREIGGAAIGAYTNLQRQEPQRDGESDDDYARRLAQGVVSGAIGGAGLAAFTRPGVRSALRPASQKLGIMPGAGPGGGGGMAQAALPGMGAKSQPVKPSAFWEKFDAWRYASMLSNWKTHANNFISNAVETGARPAELAISGQYRAAASDLSATVGAIPSALHLAVDTFLGRGITPNAIGGTKTQGVRTHAFGTSIPGRIISAPLDALAASDDFFKSINYAGALHSEAYKISGGDSQKAIALIAAPSAELVARAQKRARIATFQEDAGALVEAIQNVRSSSPAGRLVLGFVLPFVRTPANIYRRGLSMTGRALDPTFGAAEYGIRRARGESSSDAQIAIGKNVMSKVVVGSAAYLATQGLLTGAGPQDATRRQELEATGWQANSVKIGDRWVSYNNLGPAAIPLGLVANAWEAYRDGQKVDADTANEVLRRVSRTLVDASWLKSFSDLVKGAESGGFVKGLSNTAAGVASSLLPLSGAAGQVEQIVDPTSRSRSTLAEKVGGRIPGASQFIEPQVDVYGRPRQSYREEPGDIGGKIAQILLPYRSSRERKDDPVTTEVARLAGGSGNLDIGRALGGGNLVEAQPGRSIGARLFPEKYDGVKQTPEAQRKIQTEMGRAAYTYLAQRIADPAYQSLPDERKAADLKGAVGVAYQLQDRLMGEKIERDDRHKALLAWQSVPQYEGISGSVEKIREDNFRIAKAHAKLAAFREQYGKGKGDERLYQEDRAAFRLAQRDRYPSDFLKPKRDRVNKQYNGALDQIDKGGLVGTSSTVLDDTNFDDTP